MRTRNYQANPRAADALSSAIDTRYGALGARGAELRQALLAVCQSFLAKGLGDRDAEQKLSSPDDAVYWQQLTEVLLTNRLAREGLDVSHPRKGPDFLLERDGRKIWIEVVCPEPKGIPAEWLNPTPGGAGSLPHEAILLRWTAAISAKALVLLGDGKRQGYLGSGVVGPDDAYVIAVNGRLLRGFGGCSLRSME